MSKKKEKKKNLINYEKPLDHSIPKHTWQSVAGKFTCFISPFKVLLLDESQQVVLANKIQVLQYDNFGNVILNEYPEPHWYSSRLFMYIFTYISLCNYRPCQSLEN